MPDPHLDLDQLPTVTRLRADLESAFATDEAASATAARRRWRRRPQGRSLAALAALVTAVGGGIALAQSGGGGRPVSPEEWLAGKRALPEMQITPDQLADLAILRRPRTPFDAVDSRDISVLSRSSFTGASGANFELSRRAQGFASGAAWVIPAAASVCVVADARLTPRSESVPGSNGAAGCEPNGAIPTGKLMVSSSTAREPDVTLVAGLVPDGVEAITAKSPGGRTWTIPVHENVYMASVTGPAQLSFDGPSGHVTLEPIDTLPELEGRAPMKTGSR